MRAFDETWDVGEDDFLVVDHRHPQIRLQGGKGILGDFGMGVREHGQQGTLTSIGYTYDAHVGDELEFQPQPSFLTRFALFGQSRRLVDRGTKGSVAAAAAAASGHQQPLIPGHQLTQIIICLGVVDNRTRGHWHLDIGALCALFVTAAAVGASFRLEMDAPAKM